MQWLVAIIRKILSLRYRIHVQGIEVIDEVLKKKKGILFLPNHPAEIDPVILTILILKKTTLTPLVTERFFESRWIAFFLRRVKALPITSMDSVVNQWKAKEIHKIYETIRTTLDQGGHFLIYPAGRLKSIGKEVIGGASFAYNLFTETSDVEVVLIRTTGLWGSTFSRYFTGRSPSFSQVIWEGIKTLVKNGIFFTPKRDVFITFERGTDSLRALKDKLSFNQYLEKWYNQYPEEEEKPNFVSYSFYKKKFLQKEHKEKISYFSEEKAIPDNIKKEVVDFLAKITKKAPEKLEKELRLSTDLGLDSLDMAEIYTFLYTKYSVKDLPPASLQTIEDLFKAAAGFFKEELFLKETAVKCATLPAEPTRKDPVFAEGTTLPEVFIRAALENPSWIASADAISGVLSYRKMLLAALALSFAIKRNYPEKKIGIMLPALSSAYIVTLAALFANKVPVMLNWTAGKRALEHAQEVAELKAVFTSKRFLERLDDAEFGQVQELLVYLEAFRSSVSFRDKLKALLYTFKQPLSLLKTLTLEKIKEEDTAALLFTSGTESLPKGVPLSHQNILFDQRAAFSCIHFSGNDAFYSVLPPFHSFGFAVTGLLPLFARLKVIYSPNPTDSSRMAEEIAFWKPTVFCAAPSFIKSLFFAAKPEQLSSLKLVVAGAEKTPPMVYEYVEKQLHGAKFIEGYGITECSPIVTMMHEKGPFEGVGSPLPGVEVRILDPETGNFLPPNTEGEVCIFGPNVFKGYLGIAKDPFMEKEGKKWYRSGDRGKLTENGCLVISGRYKRFMKIGGEMISLGGLEEDVEAIVKKSGKYPDTDVPQLAIGSKKENEEKGEIYLFTMLDLDLDPINEALREKGYPRLVKIHKIIQVKEIPLLGTGKINHRYLEENFS